MTMSMNRGAAVAIGALLLIGANAPSAIAEDEGPGLQAAPAGDDLFTDSDGGYFEFCSQQDTRAPAQRNFGTDSTNYYVLPPMAFDTRSPRSTRIVVTRTDS